MIANTCRITFLYKVDHGMKVEQTECTESQLNDFLGHLFSVQIRNEDDFGKKVTVNSTEDNRICDLEVIIDDKITIEVVRNIQRDSLHELYYSAIEELKA